MWLRGEKQEPFFCKGLPLLGGELVLSWDFLGAYVDNAALFGESPAKVSRSCGLVKVEMSGIFRDVGTEVPCFE
jgi:hypothetical protein